MKSMVKGSCGAGLAFALLSVGCATQGVRHAYDGPQKAPHELAKVIGTTNVNVRVFGQRDRISIVEVDDDNVLPWYSLASAPTAVYVEPGRHKIGARYEWVHGVANGPIWVNAHSNRVYQIKVMNPESRTERVYFVIEDVTAQTLVGGGDAPATPPAPAQP